MNRLQCHVCGEKELADFAVLDHREICRCRNCSYVWAKVYDEAAVTKAYENDYYPSADHPKIAAWNEENEAVWQGLFNSAQACKKNPQSLLDIGAGTGGFVLAFHKKLPDTEISVIESSAAALEYIQRELPGVKVPAKDGDDLDKIEDCYDMITVFQTLEHVVAPDVFLRKIHERLKPGGKVLITVPNRYSYKVFLKGAADQFCYGNTTHLQFFSKGSMSLLLKNTGFSKVTRLVEKGGGQFSGFVAECQWVLRKLAFSTELRFVAEK